MLKELQINCSNSWLKTLLSQYFLVLQPSDNADLLIVENELSFTLKCQQQSFDIPKPASIMMMVNLIEQIKQGLDKTIIIGDVIFYPSQRMVMFREEKINLTQKEAEILLHLYSNPGYIDKATLLEAIWGYSSDILTHTLETHIYKLRSKFTDKYDIIHSSDAGYALNLRSQ